MEMYPPARIPFPAVRGYFGEKLYTYQTQMPPTNILTILQHDPRSDNWKALPPDLQERYEHVQRATDKGRRADLMSYIARKIGTQTPILGAFPAISIGMTLPVHFDSMAEVQHLGFLQIESGGPNQAILLDGLARVTAALMLIEQERSAQNFRDGYTPTQRLFTFPVTIYAPVAGALTVDELGQLFYDFNYLQKRIAPAHAIALDQSDLYISLTNHLGNETLSRYGGMDSRSASLHKQSKAIVVQQVLLRFVRGACEGYTFQMSNRARVDAPHLVPESYQHYAQCLASFVLAFAEKMGDKRFLDRDSLHLTSPGWQVLGLVFHDLYIRLEASPSTIENVMKRLADIDWSRYNPDWLSYLGEPEILKETGQPRTDATGRVRIKMARYGQGGIARLRDYVYEKTGLAVLTADLPTDAAA
jgi:hypothetical protein